MLSSTTSSSCRAILKRRIQLWHHVSVLQLSSTLLLYNQLHTTGSYTLRTMSSSSGTPKDGKDTGTKQQPTVHIAPSARKKPIRNKYAHLNKPKPFLPADMITATRVIPGIELERERKERLSKIDPNEKKKKIRVPIGVEVLLDEDGNVIESSLLPNAPPPDVTFRTLNSHLLEKNSYDDIMKLVEAEEQKFVDAEKAKFLDRPWKPGLRKRPLRFSYSLEDMEHEMIPELRNVKRWSLLDHRCGAIGMKVGMVPIYDPVWGNRFACTVISIEQNIVLNHKTIEKNGYSAVTIAAGERKYKNVPVSVRGQFKHLMQFSAAAHSKRKKDRNAYEMQQQMRSSTSTSMNDTTEIDYDGYDPNSLEDDPTGLLIKREHPPSLIREFRISDEEYFIPIGSPIHARHFVPGQNVDIAGITKGKGFQGGMKLHHFGGMPASHGTSLAHRSIGSTGSCQDPGRVFKGKKMPGRMGSNRVTIQNLRILKIDRACNLIYVIGAVPGNNGTFVEIRDAVKKPLWKTKLVAGEIKQPPVPTYEYDPNIDGVGGNIYVNRTTNMAQVTQLGEHEEYMPIPEIDPLDPDTSDEPEYT